MIVKQLINKSSTLDINDCKRIVEEIVDYKNLADYYNDFKIKNDLKGIQAGYDYITKNIYLNYKAMLKKVITYMSYSDISISILKHFNKKSYIHFLNFIIIHALFHEINHIEQIKKWYNDELEDENLIESISTMVLNFDTYKKDSSNFLFEYDAEVRAKNDFLTLADHNFEYKEEPLFLYNKCFLIELLSFYFNNLSFPKQRQYEYFMSELFKAKEFILSPDMSELENLFHGNKIKDETYDLLHVMCFDKQVKTRNFFNYIK